jgi:hypothetical protein
MAKESCPASRSLELGASIDNVLGTLRAARHALHACPGSAALSVHWHIRHCPCSGTFECHIVVCLALASTPRRQGSMPRCHSRVRLRSVASRMMPRRISRRSSTHQGHTSEPHQRRDALLDIRAGRTFVDALAMLMYSAEGMIEMTCYGVFNTVISV